MFKFWIYARHHFDFWRVFADFSQSVPQLSFKKLKKLAAGHFEKYQQTLSKNESDDAHIFNIWTKYFMYILSILKFDIVCLFSGRMKKNRLGKNFIIILSDSYSQIERSHFTFVLPMKFSKCNSACGLWSDYENFCPIVIF